MARTHAVELSIRPGQVELRVTTPHGVEPATWRREPDRWVGPTTTPEGLDGVIEMALDHADAMARAPIVSRERRQPHGVA